MGIDLSPHAGLHVDHSGQLLHSVEQEIAFLYGFLVLPVLTIRSGREKKRTSNAQLVAHRANRDLND